jgi:hypothetical protein
MSVPKPGLNVHETGRLPLSDRADQYRCAACGSGCRNLVDSASLLDGSAVRLTKLAINRAELAETVNRPVSLRIYPERLVVAAEGQILCEHARLIQRSHDVPPRTFYDWRHYLAVVQRKPGALRNGAPFAELPKGFRQLQDHMLRRPGGDREMVDILALVLHHDEQAVLTAVELALEGGVPTKTHVLNLLHRLIDGKTTNGPTIDTPQALILHREPKANVERYDGLRAQLAGGRHAS